MLKSPAGAAGRANRYVIGVSEEERKKGQKSYMKKYGLRIFQNLRRFATPKVDK